MYVHIVYYVHTYLPTYLHTYIHTYIHTCIHTYIHTYIYTYIHTNIYIHTLDSKPQDSKSQASSRSLWFGISFGAATLSRSLWFGQFAVLLSKLVVWNARRLSKLVVWNAHRLSKLVVWNAHRLSKLVVWNARNLEACELLVRKNIVLWKPTCWCFAGHTFDRCHGTNLIIFFLTTA